MLGVRRSQVQVLSADSPTSGNVVLVRATAAELPQISLGEPCACVFLHPRCGARAVMRIRSSLLPCAAAAAALAAGCASSSSRDDRPVTMSRAAAAAVAHAEAMAEGGEGAGYET